MHQARLFGLSGVLAAICLTLAGCSPPPRTVEVIGRVTYEGQPVQGALVVFISDFRDDAPAHGVTDADGRYHLNTFFASHDMPRGAVPDRHYTAAISKYERFSGELVSRKMAALSASGGNVRNYLREQAVYDLWPNGVPEGWPMDYVPSMGIPPRLLGNHEALTKMTELQGGIPLLPTKYADQATSGFEATVERSDDPQVFDFDLTGPLEQIERRMPDSTPAPPTGGLPSQG